MVLVAVDTGREPWPDIQEPILDENSSILDIAVHADTMKTVVNICESALMASLTIPLEEVLSAMEQAMNDTLNREKDSDPPTAVDYVITFKVENVLHKLVSQWGRFTQATMDAYKATRDGGDVHSDV